MKTILEFALPQVTQNEPQSCDKFDCFRIMTVKKALLADGLINLRMPFLKILRLLEFLIFRSRLFHCIMADTKKYFFGKLCLALKKGTFYILLVQYSELLTRINLKRSKFIFCRIYL